MRPLGAVRGDRVDAGGGRRLRGGRDGRTAATIDANHAYTLAELIDIAEHNNPRTRVVWERAKQRAAALGIAKSAYYPILAGIAAAADERIIDPFPKPLAPDGYTMVMVPVVQAEVKLQVFLFDAGERAAHVDAATQEKLAAGAAFIQTNQEIAFRVSSGYYRLLTARERLQAAEETLKTARIVLDAAQARLENGRGTLPDVLHAKSRNRTAVFDRETADGDEKIARIALTEAMGTEPTTNIQIDAQNGAPAPQDLTLSIDELINRGLANRPDLMAAAAEIRAADDAIRMAKAEFKPKVVVAGSAAQAPCGRLRATANWDRPASRRGLPRWRSNGSCSMAGRGRINSRRRSRGSARRRTR